MFNLIRKDIVLQKNIGGFVFGIMCLFNVRYFSNLGWGCI